MLVKPFTEKSQPEFGIQEQDLVSWKITIGKWYRGPVKPGSPYAKKD